MPRYSDEKATLTWGVASKKIEECKFGNEIAAPIYEEEHLMGGRSGGELRRD